MLEDRFRRLAIVHFGKQTAPGADRRLQHHRVPQLLDRLQRRCFREGHTQRRLHHAVIFERGRGEDLVAAAPRHLVAVDASDADAFEETQGVHGPGVVDAALEHDIDSGFSFRSNMSFRSSMKTISTRSGARAP